MHPNAYSPAEWEKIVAFSATKETPFLLVSLDRVRQKFQAFRTHFPNAKIYYAVKANPGKEVLALLRDLGSYFDIASVYELDQMLDLGVTPDRLSFGNTIKKARHVREAYDKGIRLFASDSEADVRHLAKEAPGSRIFFRLLMDAVTSDSDWPLSRKFGCQPRMLTELVSLAADLGLEPYGISFHVGSQQREPERWIAPIDTAAGIFTALREHGHRPWLLDLGGGFPASHAVPCPPLAVYGRTIEAAVQAAFGAHRPRLIAEPGRALVGDAGVLEASVLGVAHRAGRRWVYLDAGIFNGLTETLGEAIHYRLRTSATGAPAAAVLAGPTCDSADVMYRCVDLPDDLAEGDRVWFAAAGVYTTSYASAFNGFAPLRTELTDTLPCVG